MGDGAMVHDYPTHAGDVNGDGRTDLIFVGQNWAGPGLNIRVKLSNGDGTWTFPGTQVMGDGAFVHSYPAHVGDIDGDGDDDLILVGQGWFGAGLNIRVKLSNGDGTFTPLAETHGDGPNVHTYPTLIGQLNDDNRTDLIFQGQGWNGPGLNIRTKFSNGNGTWGHVFQVMGDGVKVHEHPPFAGDVDGDGRTDLIYILSY